jgi:hypothetical protein
VHALPEEVLPRELYALREMIGLLILIKFLDITGLDISSP